MDNESNMEVKEKKQTAGAQNRKPIWPMFLLGLGIILIAGLIAGYFVMVRAVGAASTNPTVITIAETLNYPAAKVDGKKISYSEFVNDLRALKIYSSHEQGLENSSEKELAGQVIARLILSEISQRLADRYEVELIDEEVDSASEFILANYESKEQADADTERLYGWNFDQYKERVLKPLMLDDKIYQYLAANYEDSENKYRSSEMIEVKSAHILFMTDEENQEQVKQDARQVLDRINQGEDFAKLAQEYSEDTASAVKGGDLGWMDPGMTVPEFEQALRDLNPGEISQELVKTDYGYHIIKVEDKRGVFDYESFVLDQVDESDIDINIDVEDPFQTENSDEQS